MRPVLIQRSNGRSIADKAFCTEAVSERISGWFRRDSVGPGEGLLIAPCASIHSFGMNFSMDVVFLDEGLRIKKIAKNVRPNRVAFAHLSGLLFSWKSQALELPAGAADGLLVGETLNMTER
ncbi:MAG: DUF192 domain-containing protein, partial [candidate division FCPU426 bacterium]